MLLFQALPLNFAQDFSFFFFFVVLGFELSASNLLGKHSTTWAMTHFLLACYFFFLIGTLAFATAGHGQWLSYLPLHPQ
jgi:hypothetical protein